LVAVAALETLVDVFDEVVVTSVLETVFALLVLLKLEEVDFVDDVEVFVLLVLLVDLRLEDVLVNFWVETEDDVVLFMLLEVVLVDF
jgi:hypothetical protein